MLPISKVGSVRDAFHKFEKALQNTVNEFTPFKKASRREKKISQTPLLTCELLNKIKTKSKLFKQLHKKFDKDNFEKYKKQRKV